MCGLSRVLCARLRARGRTRFDPRPSGSSPGQGRGWRASAPFDSLPLVIFGVLRERLRQCGGSATLLSFVTCVVLDPVIAVRGH